MAQLDGPVLEVDLLSGLVEGMVCHHLEEGEMATGLAHIVDVIEPDAGLGDAEGIGRRVDDPVQHPGLEVVDRSLGEENVVAPTRHDRVSLDTAMAVLLKEGEICLSGSVQVQRYVGRRVPDEGVLHARRLPACGPVAQGPEVALALGALLAHEPIVKEELKLEVGLRHDPQYKKDPISNFSNFQRSI